jgi:hypothetical protein
VEKGLYFPGWKSPYPWREQKGFARFEHADYVNLGLAGVLACVLGWGYQGRMEADSPIPETTKPSHCREGFVLYGAAPRVEWIFNYLPLMIFLKVNILFYL